MKTKDQITTQIAGGIFVCWVIGSQARDGFIHEDITLDFRQDFKTKADAEAWGVNRAAELKSNTSFPSQIRVGVEGGSARWITNI
jgi:hypothetical protein